MNSFLAFSILAKSGIFFLKYIIEAAARLRNPTNRNGPNNGILLTAPILQVPNRLLPNYPDIYKYKVKLKASTITNICLATIGISLAELSRPPLTFITKYIRNSILYRNSAVLKNKDTIALVIQKGLEEDSYPFDYKFYTPELK